MIEEIFHIKNIDCATCAAKIEHGLKHMDGVEDAVLDFAAQTLRVKAIDRDRIIEKVRAIDPAVELIAREHASGQTSALETALEIVPGTEIAFLVLSALLFVLFLAFEETLYQPPLAGLRILIVIAAYLVVAWGVIVNALRTITRLTLFDENVLMVIATIGAIVIQAYSEAIGVMFFYRIGELLQKLAVNRSRRSVRRLLAARPDKAMVISPMGREVRNPESVSVGEIIQVRPGEKIPLDGKILNGTSQVDTSPLTGESVPLRRKPGDAVMAGQINKTGTMTISVTRPFRESSISKIMHLVENATAQKARTEQFITTFARYYTPAVVMTAAAIALLPPLFLDGASPEAWLYRALVILVISCPCALVVSIPLGYFAGIGKASRQGILIKGSNYIDALSSLKTIVFDKTGTLTKGVFAVRNIVSVNGFSPKEILEFAAAAEHQSTHPIATSILAEFFATGGSLAADRIEQHQNIDGKGVAAAYKGHRIFVGNDSLLHQENVAHDQCAFNTTVANVVVDGTLTGYILIGDEIRPDAHQAVVRLRELGIKQVAMLTGDNLCAAQAVAEKLNLDTVHADLLPEQKVEMFESISRQADHHGTIGFVGDGLNDSPVIARADVGIAMGAMGSDAAIETADVVLVADSPSKVAEAVIIAQKTRTIVWQNIALALLIKGVFISFGAFGLASMWEAVFADMGTALLAILNASRILRG